MKDIIQPISCYQNTEMYASQSPRNQCKGKQSGKCITIKVYDASDNTNAQ